MHRDSGLALSRIGKASVPPLVKALADKSTQVAVMGAIESCGGIAAVAVPPLRELLKEKDATIRGNAVTTLARIAYGNKDVVTDLLALVKDDSDATVRALAVDAFKFLGADPKLTGPVIREATKDKNPLVRTMALETLKFVDPEGKDKN